MQLTDEFSQQRQPDPPRVVMVLEGMFPTHGGGGAENQVLSLAKHFTAQKVAVTVLVPRTLGPRESLRENYQGVPVERLPFPRIRLFGGVVLLLQLARWLVRERRTYVAIHAHVAGNMAAVCCVAGRWLGKPVTVKYTGFVDVEHRSASAGWSARFRDRALRRATWIQATSRRIADGLVKSGFSAGQIRPIPNAVDLARFADAHARRQALRRSLNLDPDALIAVYCGRLTQVKGVHVLLEAWELAFGARPDAKLLIVGDGSAASQKRLRAQAAQMRSACGVSFLGAQARVEDLYGAADFSVLPSLAEGLSNSLLESMASGVPVVGTRVSGTEDFIDDGITGWICEPGDAAQLSAALLRAASASPDQRAAVGRQARHRVAARASIEAIAGELAGLYGIAHLSGKPCAA